MWDSLCVCKFHPTHEMREYFELIEAGRCRRIRASQSQVCEVVCWCQCFAGWQAKCLKDCGFNIHCDLSPFVWEEK